MTHKRWFIPVVAAGAILLVAAVAVAGIFVGMMIERNRGSDVAAKPKGLVRIYVSDKATTQQVDALRQLIGDTPDVGNVVYITKTEALERVRLEAGPQAQFIFENLTSDTPPASFEVQVKDADQVDAVVAKFIGNPAVDDNAPGSNKHDSVIGSVSQPQTL